MRLIFVYILLLCIPPVIVRAQDQDSITFVDFNWSAIQVEEGILWKPAEIKDLFSSNQSINIVEIDLKKHHHRLKLAGISDRLKPTSAFAQESDALIAINGGFFDMKNGGAVDFIKIDNTVVNGQISSNVRADGFLAFDETQVRIAEIVDSTKYFEALPNILVSGPLLLSDKKSVALVSNPFNDHRHPRSAVALKGDTLVLVTVDGRNAQAQGMTLAELTDILRWYGVDNAMNLDGGGSTALYIRDQTPNSIVNYPSDNKLFDHEGERSVANVIMIQ